MPQGDVQITWLGHASFKIVSAQGRVVYIDPWLSGPTCPDDQKQPDRADLILVTHGHFDHLGDTVDVAKRTSAQVICNWEMSVWLESQGVTSATGMNKGGTLDLNGIKITMVGADHSSGIKGEHGIVDGGNPCGYVVQLENGFTLYHAGDTNVFGDMRLIGELYSPELALLPIGGHFTMGPREAAHAARLLGVKQVVPMHFGTFPILTGTPEQLREHLGGIAEVVPLEPGRSL